jgi:hypothetical protein
MNHQRLKTLIEQADVDPPRRDADSLGLAARVRRLHRWRRRRRLALAGSVLLVVGGLFWRSLADRRGGELANFVPDKPSPASPQDASAGDRLREAGTKIEREELIVERLLAAERARRLAAAAEAAQTGLDRQLLPDRQVGEAAMTILLCGDQRAKRPDGLQAARGDYTSVIQLFPNTIWAKQAETRLAALKP